MRIVLRRFVEQWLAVAISCALCAAPAAAQDDDVGTARRAYPFLGDRLTVHIEADSPGVIRLIRGEDGRLEVAARAEDGFPGFGLADRGGDALVLTAIGADRAEYLVVVPANVRVTVRLPDRHVAEVFAGMDRSATYEWRRPPRARKKRGG